MQVKRVPLRMCAGCGEMKPKKELVRVVKPPEGEISIDLTGKKAGRGAYCLPFSRVFEKGPEKPPDRALLPVQNPDEFTTPGGGAENHQN